jgi:4-hydroxythreonine-4-phosphate dehydrogenase
VSGRPRLALTVGDPAGIGPEIVLRALASAEFASAEWVVYGPLASLAERARRLGLPDPASVAAGAVDIPGSPVPLGAVSAEGGRIAAAAVLAAAADACAGRVFGMVTAPLHKESLRAAGHPWPGHTEMLAEATGVADVAMMFVGGGLRVALLTIHRSLRSVPDAITQAETERIVRLVHRELPRFGAARRRIAVCGVNPHAGEHGRFGREDEEALRPAVAALAAEGIAVTGPLPADTAFVRAVQGEFDAVVAAYHDQGLVPVKLLAFGRAVNVTLGLPFVRTSVDHGTAFDIAAKGTADPGSLLAAMAMAVELTSSRDGSSSDRLDPSREF